MNRIILIIFMFCLAGFLFLTERVSGENENGSRFFNERGCALCHDQTEDQSVWGLGPSLKQIAEAYKGREGDLSKFLKGGCKPIVDEPRYPIMHGEIVSIKDMSDSQIEALARFIYSKQ